VPELILRYEKNGRSTYLSIEKDVDLNSIVKCLMDTGVESVTIGRDMPYAEWIEEREKDL